MGGNCLKHYGIETKRVDIDEFLSIQNDVANRLKNSGFNVLTLPYYRSKRDFGDLDILVESGPDIQKHIVRLFSPDKISKNDGVYTFNYRDFQIDLISRRKDDLGNAHFYLSYNDLHNLIGRTAHHMGLKHGWQGLMFPIRQKLFDESTENHSDHVINTLVLSKNPEEILEFLGYDYHRYEQGFDDLEDIFLYTVSTPYFNSFNFKIENLNHQNRTRNRKRKMFMGFLKWLEEHPEYDKKFDFGDKKDWIDRINNKWPIKEQIEIERQKFLYIKQVRTKFNGELVMGWVNISGPALGAILTSFKKYIHSIENIDFLDWLYKNNAEYIKSIFISWYEGIVKQLDDLCE